MRTTPYAVLELPNSATKEQVKEAFRRLCLIYHPDKCAPHLKPVAEAKFKTIKDAYDAILRGQAGYAPPPPGSGPSAAYANAYWRAHGHGMDPGAPPRTGGPFGGYSKESDFYRAMFRTTRNNPLLLIMTGLFAIPAVSMLTSILNGNTGFIKQFKNEGIHMFSESRYRVNGRSTLHNPYSIRSLKNIEDSYIYKSDKYKHLRKPAEEELQPAQ